MRRNNLGTVQSDHGRRPEDVYGWLWRVIGLGVGLDALARGYATYGLLGRPGALPGVMAAAWPTNFTWILGLGLFPLVLLRFRRARGVERRQLKWFAAAGLILVAVPVADTISPFGFDSNPLLELVSTWPLYVGTGIGILPYRLYDIDRLLNPPWSTGRSRSSLGLATAPPCWWPPSCPAASVGSRRAGPSPGPPWPPRPCSSPPGAASMRWWTGGSTGAAMTPRAPSRRSPPACASSSTWTR
jgi:hypothetical protein